MAHKTVHKMHEGQVVIRCPGCKRWQELPIEHDWYSIDRDGVVSPEFVCMCGQGRGRYDCFFHGHIAITNWGGGAVGE